MILIGYDGSDDSRAAIEHAAALMPGAETMVVTVWEPFATMLTRTPAGLGPLAGLGDVGDMDIEAKTAARNRAAEGAQLASAAGLKASAQIVSQAGSVADAIIAQAERLDVDAIVLGSRGLTGLRSILLGSVSHAVVQHADRTVVVTPSGPVAERRRHRNDDVDAGPENEAEAA